MILVDNSGGSFAFQTNNGVPILDFFHDKQDEELKLMIPYLKSLKHKDVQQTNKKTFKLTELVRCSTRKEILNKLLELKKN
jgi:CTD small phosphatase-like protein 2